MRSTQLWWSTSPSRNDTTGAMGGRRLPVASISLDLGRRRVIPGARVVEFDAGHHPFLSRPDAFAQTIATEIDLVRSVSA